MGVSQTKNNFRWSVFVFAFLCLASSAFYVAADESSTTDVVVFDDIDSDGLSNEEEKIYGTDPDVADTDGDGYSDGVEIEGGFDPLKPAPGDRAVPEEAQPEETVSDPNAVNLTEKASEELSNVVSEKGKDGEITAEDLDTVLANVMASSNEEPVLPEVNPDSFKIKELPKKLSEDELKEQNREDVVEYLTLVGYILLSNLPVQIKNSEQLQGYGQRSALELMTSIATGNYSFLDQTEARAKKALDEINAIEVPESMLATHIKAVSLLTFASNLKQTISQTVSPDDPLGQINIFSRIQGGMLTLENFIWETQSLLTDFGISKIPLDV